MKEKTFTRLLIATVAAGIILTLAHLIYIIYAYQNCSIIYFIAKELW